MSIKLVQLPEMFWEENNVERKRYALFSLMASAVGPEKPGYLFSKLSSLPYQRASAPRRTATGSLLKRQDR
jgi:hypothetical protein